jgi:hypothetical protein
MWHGLSHSMFLFVNWFVFSLYYVHVFGFGAKIMAPLSFGRFSFYLLVVSFSFSFIVYMHLNFGQEAQPPLFFGSFFFHLLVIFSFVLLYCVHAYQNQCYMCTKISVIQWLASSGRLVFRKNSCNFDGVPIRHVVSKTTCYDFGPRCWEFKFHT